MKLSVFLLAFLFSCSHGNIKSLATLYSTAWFQKAGEAKALQYQAFNLATQKIASQLKTKSKLPRAVVFDIDETVLDNSPYQAKAIDEKFEYPHLWKEWIASGNCLAIPGAKEFLQFLDQHKITIFYISNRKLNQMESTFENLKRVGFPVLKENILLRDKTLNKSERRSVVLAHYNVLLYMGDNLTDFPGFDDVTSWDDRNERVVKNQSLFGDKFIVLPNPVYGDWMNILIDNKYELSVEERNQMVIKKLQSF